MFPSARALTALAPGSGVLSMKPSLQILISLRIVAVLFILGGISAIIEILVSLTHGNINLNFGVLGLFIGIGLLRLRRGWRTCGLVFTWLGLVGVPLIALFFLGHSGPLDFKIFGQEVGHAPKEFGLVLCVALFALLVWQYRVLTRPDVRELFGLPSS